METKTTTKLAGSCHCGKVRFEFDAPADTHGSRCNCTICRRVGQLGAMGKPAAFRLLAGEDQVTAYEWGAKISTRYFCTTCGIHCYAKGHLAEVGGDYVSVNLNCVDRDFDEAKVTYWDGRHDGWEKGPRGTPYPVKAASA